MYLYRSRISLLQAIMNEDTIYQVFAVFAVFAILHRLAANNLVYVGTYVGSSARYKQVYSFNFLRPLSTTPAPQIQLHVKRSFCCAYMCPIHAEYLKGRCLRSLFFIALTPQS